MITKFSEIVGNQVAYDSSGNLRKNEQYFGLSTDTKPSLAKNASVFYEMNTKKVFMFDEQNKEWIEQ